MEHNFRKVYITSAINSSDTTAYTLAVHSSF